jgi:hypothetical protein
MTGTRGVCDRWKATLTGAVAGGPARPLGVKVADGVVVVGAGARNREIRGCSRGKVTLGQPLCGTPVNAQGHVLDGTAGLAARQRGAGWRVRQRGRGGGGRGVDVDCA